MTKQLTPDQLELKIRENRARRAARRQGYELAKIDKRDPRALGHGRWKLAEPGGKLVISHVVRGIETGASLDEIEAKLGLSGE